MKGKVHRFYLLLFLFCATTYVFAQKKAPHMSVDACKDIKLTCPQCYNDCVATVNAQNKVVDYINSGGIVHSPLEDKRDAAYNKLANCVKPCDTGSGNKTYNQLKQTQQIVGQFATEVFDGATTKLKQKTAALKREVENEKQKTDLAKQQYENAVAQNQTSENDVAQNDNVAGKIINAAQKEDLESSMGDPTQTIASSNTVQQQAQAGKDQLFASIQEKINAISKKSKGDCNPQHSKGSSFTVNEVPGSEPCRFKNNMVVWSEWVPIGNDLEISYVPLSLSQDRMYSVADGMARIMDYGFIRFRIGAKHDPNITIGGRLYIYYLKDNGEEDRTFQPIYFDAKEKTIDEDMGMWYLGHKITKVVWDNAQCWHKE